VGIEDDLDRTCEALHKINKHAKKYAELADENYRRGKKATARLNSVKKKALYTIKSKILKELYGHGQYDRIEQHEIDGREYYCLYIEEWSFHSPKQEWDEKQPSDDEVATHETIEKFSATTDAHTDMSLKKALLYLNNEFGYNANKYLEEKKVRYGYQSYFAGWNYLG